MEKEDASKHTKEMRNSPTEGKIARLRYRRQHLPRHHPPLYYNPQIRCRDTDQGIETTPLHGGKSAV